MTTLPPFCLVPRNLLEPSEPIQACRGIAVTFFYTLQEILYVPFALVFKLKNSLQISQLNSNKTLESSYKSVYSTKTFHDTKNLPNDLLYIYSLLIQTDFRYCPHFFDHVKLGATYGRKRELETSHLFYQWTSN
jgi:hypothetical protein